MELRWPNQQQEPEASDAETAGTEEPSGGGGAESQTSSLSGGRFRFRQNPETQEDTPEAENAALNITLATGAEARGDTARELDDTAFGLRYVSYRNENRFFEQTDDSNIGLIVWPGGSLSEVRSDRYGLEHPDLYAEETGKPGFSEMMTYANSEGAALSIVIPTLRYVDDPASLTEDLDGFLTTLLSGGYGELPSELILEVGSEFYAHFAESDASAATQYGEIANAIVEQIATALSDASINTVNADLTIAVQSGRTLEEDEDIRAEMSDLALENTDMIIHHRFTPRAEGLDDRIDDVTAISDAWQADVELAGGEAPGLFVSAWNVASLTREEALSRFLDENPGYERGDIDLDGRTHVAFETYYQDLLGRFDYGADHPGLMIDAFHSYALAGMTAGAAFGTDITHAGRLSLRDVDGEDHVFAGGEALRMIYETVEGTYALDTENDPDDDSAVSSFAFEGDDKLVIFLTSGDLAPGEVTLDLAGLGSDYISLWADQLETVENPDWMTDFGIVDNAEVDESNEAETYALGEQSGADVQVTGDGLSLTMGSNAFVRIVLVKTEEAADAISQVSLGDEIDLMPFAPADEDLSEFPIPMLPAEDAVIDEPEEEETAQLEFGRLRFGLLAGFA